jgi:uncharacterized membrane protein HdeD (DUF308 family)
MVESKQLQALNSRGFKASLIAVFFLSLCCSTIAAAADSTTPDAGTMLSNFAATIPQFMKLVTATAYVMGMALIFKGLLALKQYGEARTQMSGQHELKGPLIFMAVGTALLYLPTSVSAGLTTFWTEPNPYGYETTNGDQWASLINNCYLVVQLIGTVAFIRGLLILTQLGGHGQPGTMTKGFTYIVSGALCINLYDFVNAVETTLGISGVGG